MVTTKRNIIISTAVAIVISILFITGGLEKLELISIDLRYKILPPQPEAPVVLLALDQDSIKEMGVWPWPRSIYAGTFETLTREGARSIIVDLDFSSRGASSDEDKMLTEAVRKSVPTYFAMHMVEKTNEAGFHIKSLSLPFKQLSDAAEGVGSIVFEVDSDGTVRKLPPIMEFADDRFMPLGFFGASSIKKNAAYDIPSGSMINITGSWLIRPGTSHPR